MPINVLPAILGGKVAPQAPTFNDTGLQSPASVGDRFGAESNSWTNPNNVLTATDAALATRFFLQNTSNSFYVKDFNFSIPAGSFVYGYEVEVRWRSTRTDSRLFMDGVVQNLGGGFSDLVDQFAIGSTANSSTSLRTDVVSTGNRVIGWLTDEANAISYLNGNVNAEIRCRFVQPNSTGTATISIAYIRMRLLYLTPAAGNKLTLVTAFGSTGANVATGTTAWTNPGNAVSDNASFANVDLPKNGDSQILRVSDFGLSIPSDAICAALMAESDWGALCNQTNFDTLGFFTGSLSHPVDLLTYSGIGGNFAEPWRQSKSGSYPNDVVAGVCMHGTVDTTKLANYTPAVLNSSSMAVDCKLHSQDPLSNPPNATCDYLKLRVLYVESA
jgi:hypothetical protein